MSDPTVRETAKPLKVEAFKCNHCNMTSLFSSNVKRHQLDWCKKNLERRTCTNCANWYDYGVNSNGMESEPQLLETWQEAGCEAIEAGTEVDKHDMGLYFARNINNECTKFIPLKDMTNA